MRKLIVANLMSLDGRYEGPGDTIATIWQHFHPDYEGDDAFHHTNVNLMRAADTMIWGGESFRGFKGYWKSAEHDPEANEVTHETARLMNAMTKYVVSDTLQESDLAPWDDAHLLRRAEAKETIAALKQGDGKNLLMFASHVLWNELLAAGLVDELCLAIGPTITGDGRCVFMGQPHVSLKLLEARTESGSGIIFTRYAVSKPE